MNGITFPKPDNKIIEDYFNQGFYQEETLSSWLSLQVQQRSNHIAIIHNDTTISYSELADKVWRLAGSLKTIGVGKGDVVAVQLPNIPEFIISYLAICTVGGVMQTLHMPYRESELSYLLEDSKAGTVICLGQFKEISPASIIQQIASSSDININIITLGNLPKGVIDFNELLSHEPLNDRHASKAIDPFVLLYTSGVTSRPKGVPHRYINILSNARSCAEEYGFNDKDKLLSVAPMSHAYGLFVCNMALAVGAISVLLPAYKPDDFINLVKTKRPTALFAAPAHFAGCLQAGLLKPEDFSSVLFVCFSGSNIPPALARKVDEILPNGKVGQLWGMSELQAGTFTRLNDKPDIRFTTAGCPTQGNQVRVVDDDGEILNAEQEGELQIKGCSVFSGYLNNLEKTQKSFIEDGWFRTGDIAILDKAGNLRITGRIKEIINRGGIKYNPIEIEEIINEMESVNICAIISIQAPVLGEKACIFVVPNKGKEVTLDQIITHLEELNIAKYKWPEKLEIINDMPLTPTNKIMREELKQTAS